MIQVGDLHAYALYRFIGTLASDSTMALTEDFVSLLPFISKFRYCFCF